MIFNYIQLRRFFRCIRDMGSTELFRNWRGNKVFLLRHDVDFDIRLARDLAVIEKEEGVVSTFFILTSCPTYNVLDKTNRQLLQEIASLGHEIGLHFDPTVYDEACLRPAVDKEADVLSFAVGQEVKSISLHNPSVHGQYPMFDGYVNAYDPSLFSDQNYLSDSCYSFRNKDPFAFIKNIDNGMVQILLHPMHYSRDGDGYDTVIVRSLQRYMKELHASFSVNTTYRQHIGEDLIATFRERSP